MSMLLNSKMKHLVPARRMRRLTLSSAPRLGPRLRELLDSPMVREGPCCVLQALAKLNGNARQESYFDLTGYECFVNHIHLEDYLDEVAVGESGKLLDSGILYSLCLGEKLSRASAPGEVFRVILSFDGADCTARFHKARKNEQWLSDNIEDYEDALLVLDCSR